MICAESEAFEKWCPHARELLDEIDADGGTAAGVNLWFNHKGEQERSRCLGAACMMWVWVDDIGGDKRRGTCGLMRSQS